MPTYAWSIVRPNCKLLGCVDAPTLSAAVRKVALRHAMPVCSWVHEPHELRGLSPLGRVSVRFAEALPPERRRPARARTATKETHR
jgi:hypothetical protein